MKYLYLTILLAALFTLPGCNDEWNDELYTRMLSLKAPINRDDVSVIYLKYKPGDEVVTYKLPVIVSGSQTNDRDYIARIDVDNDTLNFLNFDKYAHRSDLYYRQLPENFYELPSQTCHIPAGSDVGYFDINFKLSGLDLVEKWVLPLTILPDPSYTLNTYKGRQKALLWIMPFNDYSGFYNAGSMYVYFGDNTTKYMTASTREARVVDENTIFFYAGITEELAENRGDFKIKCEFLEPDEITEIEDSKTGKLTGLYVKRGKLVLSAENPALEFEVIGEPTYEIKEEFDIDRPHIIKRFITLTMEYQYKDSASSENMVFPYRCVGTMLMQRNISTLIPDEDQAIFW
ncbi:MAG: DUF4973 domain-containing protein [Dysgonamonadaceae bacterium]|jgi:hypothetical protein|uniref:DUF4973 domain-containing protein n=1 Tax=Anaerorudis cellulosivorans TaxID=3397862 RepID=UPI002220E53E|nr:DUF4973 domain-containing protein [Seramator thermalis]MCW1736083.1 DUF4973 domain-containing protein [Seramator thermalis]